MAMHRRLFLRLTALGAAAATLTSTSGCDAGADPADADVTRALARPDLLDVLGAEQVRVIGAGYRRMVPAEGSAEALYSAIHGRHPLLARVLGAPRVVPAELVRRDFAEGRTVEVQGWVLSVTEARQCALYSLVRA
jgi:hypothetical protein